MPDIDRLRNRMDDITIDMVKMLKARTDLAKDLGQLKQSIGKGIVDEDREKNLRQKVMAMSDSLGLEETVTSKFLNFLLNESVKVQSRDRSSHLSIFRKAKSLEESGRNMIHMEVGEPDFRPPDAASNALGQACEKGFFKYGQATGMPSFREALAKHASGKFNTHVMPENILVSPGGRFSVFSAITMLLNPGDEMIIIEPAWPAYADCALYAGIKARLVHTTIEDRWEPSCDDIRSIINANTKMIVLNYPNNPTGKILSEQLQDEIMGIARDNNLYVLSDEIYSDYAYVDWKSILSFNYDKSIVVQSFSKSHAMTGFRIGYSISSGKIIDAMSKMGSLCLTSVSEPIQYAAMMALDADTAGHYYTIKNRLKSLVSKARDMGLDFVDPDGAMYLYARSGKHGFDGTKMANSLLDEGLAIAPGAGFGDYKDFIRISACQDENVLMQGMHILGNKLRNMK